MAQGERKKFLASRENVANVEVLPVPMLPMANGAGAEARWDLRAWKPATPMKPATPNEAPLPPCGRAVDEAVVTFPVRDGVRQLALCRKIAGDVFNVEMWKCGNMQVWKYGNGMGAAWKRHCRAWFLRAVMMLAEKMRVRETASSIRAANLRFST